MKSCLKLVEMEVRDLLEMYELPADDTPIITGFCVMALRSDDNENGPLPLFVSWVEARIRSIPEPERAINLPFLMPN